MNNDFVKKNQEKMKQAKQMFHEETQKEDFLEEEKPQEAKKPTKKELFFKILISLFLLWIGIPVIGISEDHRSERALPECRPGYQYRLGIDSRIS